LKLKLVVIGGGEMLDEIRRIAGPTVTVMGPQPFDVLRNHYARCRALIFPGEEDFGMVPVEAMASGRPVIAFGKGGAVETVAAGTTGIFFNEQSVEAISAAIGSLADLPLDSAEIAKHAEQFGRAQFLQKMREHIDGLLARRRGAR
jgi:glycosyltransferase involved in cell wall biosynthesis